MKVGIITNSIDSGPVSIRNYIEALIKQLLKEDNIELVLIHNKKNNNPIYKGAQEIVLSNKYSYKNLYKEKIDILHVPHLGRPAPTVTQALLNKKFSKLVVTNHGMANIALPPTLCWGTSFSSKVYRYYYEHELCKWRLFRNKINLIITVSHSEQKNIGEIIPIDRIKVIYHGVDHQIFKKLNNKKLNRILEKYNIHDKFMFHISSYQPKKNIEGILKAYSILKNRFNTDIKLVIGGWQPKEILYKLINKLKLKKKDVLLLGYIPYQDLPKLYNTALAFIFPSFHESFGMPILEAMACGCPVITSNTFSMPEISGNSAIHVNPYNTFEIAKAMHLITTDDVLRKKLRRKGLNRAKKFTWKKCAKEHVKVYEEALIT